MTSTRGRIAPTPSGYLHRGNLLNFLVNATLVGPAGTLLLRIDDLDRSRYRRAYEADVFRQLERLGIQVAEVVRQSKRLLAYADALDRLRGLPQIFACPCSRKQLTVGPDHACRTANLPLDTPDTAWRFATPAETTAPADFALRDKKGRPTYQLAATVDDYEMDITVIARGRDLLPSTAAQALLSETLGYPPLHERITLYHHELIRGVEGEKLSKSAGSQSAPLLLDERTVDELRVLATRVAERLR